MNPRLTPLFALPLALASCSTVEMPSHFSTRDDLDRAFAKPAIQFSKVEIDCSVLSDDGLQKLSPITLTRGRSASTSMTKELIYPTAYDFPEIPTGSEFNADSTPQSFPVTPANPTAFGVAQIGWTLELAARPRGGFVMLEGTLTHKKAGPNIRAGGIPFQTIAVQATDALGRKVPVVLTENRAERPSIVTTAYPVSIAALPGESYTLRLGTSETATFDVKVLR